MKRLITIAALLLMALYSPARPALNRPAGVPDTLFVNGGQFHVQGLALDAEAGRMYMSFTSRFFVLDLQGRLLASIDGINGHLGAMTFDAQGRKVYASLECKDDEIGSHISQKLGAHQYSQGESTFYVAVIDVDKVNRIGTPESEAMQRIVVEEAMKDYKTNYGCSGIDGVTIAPGIGSKNHSKRYLYVAYGIYGDTTRTDNDHQIVLQYDLSRFREGAKHKNKFFIYTGNTRYGVQNMAWDPYTDNIFMAVYTGSKKQFPNYNLYAFPRMQKPVRAALKGVPGARELTLNLAQDGLLDPASGIRGWRFKWGSTGLCPIGDGWWIISRNRKISGEQTCNATLYHWTGNPEKPFEKP